MFLLEGSNTASTATIHHGDLAAVTASYLALRDLPAFRYAVWTLRTGVHWLHDHAEGVDEPDWWYECAPGVFAPWFRPNIISFARPGT